MFPTKSFVSMHSFFRDTNPECRFCVLNSCFVPKSSFAAGPRKSNLNLFPIGDRLP